MSFLLACPECGPRRVEEFSYGGELQQRPSPNATDTAWGHYLYARRNVAGIQTEWWYHRLGCSRWFLAERDTRTNEVQRTFPRGTSELPALRQGAKQSEPFPPW